MNSMFWQEWRLEKLKLIRVAPGFMVMTLMCEVLLQLVIRRHIGCILLVAFRQYQGLIQLAVQLIDLGLIMLMEPILLIPDIQYQ